MVINLKSFFFKLYYRKSLKRAIRHAKIVKSQRGYKCYVLFFPGGYRAITKAAIKSLMSSNKKYFRKGTTILDIEAMAVYITN